MATTITTRVSGSPAAGATTRVTGAPTADTTLRVTQHSALLWTFRAKSFAALSLAGLAGGPGIGGAHTTRVTGL